MCGGKEVRDKRHYHYPLLSTARETVHPHPGMVRVHIRANGGEKLMYFGRGERTAGVLGFSMQLGQNQENLGT